MDLLLVLGAIVIIAAFVVAGGIVFFPVWLGYRMHAWCKRVYVWRTRLRRVREDLALTCNEEGLGEWSTLPGKRIVLIPADYTAQALLSTKGLEGCYAATIRVGKIVKEAGCRTQVYLTLPGCSLRLQLNNPSVIPRKPNEDIPCLLDFWKTAKDMGMAIIFVSKEETRDHPPWEQALQRMRSARGNGS